MKQYLLVAISLFVGSAMAQSPCDDLNVLSVQYSPFTDTIVLVQVENNGSELFSYPGFVLINSAGDTVAKEQTNFFGIGQESEHRLQVRNGVQDPLENFEGDLELHTGFYDMLACTWDLDQSLCITGSCDSLFIGLENYGGALVIGDFQWTVEDEMGFEVETGTFNMEASSQSWIYGLCLPSGEYSYTLEALGQPSGGGPTLTVSGSRSYSSATLSEPLDWFNDPASEIEFPFFAFCTESPNGIIQQGTNSGLPTVVYNTERNRLSSSEQITHLRLYSVLGNLVYEESSSDFILQLPKLTSGAYVAVILTSKGEVRTKFVVN